VTNTLIIPNMRHSIRRAGHTMIEGKLMPLALFLAFLRIVGATGALCAALAWSLSTTGFRLATGRRVNALVLLSVIGLTARTILALLSGSVVVYFLQPTITTALVGAAFMISVPIGRPLAQRLAEDFCPLDPHTLYHPHTQRFFIRLSLLWSLASMVNAALTLWLLLTQSVTTFVLVKSCLGPAFTTVTVLIAYFGFHRALRRDGLRLHYNRHVPTETAATPAI
jgi:hypothetical protein